MKVFIVEDEDRSILYVYAEETFKNIYKEYIDTFWGCWKDVSVSLWEVDGDSKYITVQHMENLLSEEMPSMC
jgi:hypothetical protein